MRMLRLTFRSILFSLTAVLVLSSAHAQAPMAKDATPGWYRMRLGTFEITALSDGTLQLPADEIFTSVSPARIRALLSHAYLTNDVTVTVNAFLVNTGTKLVLIDTGTGASPMFGTKLGHLLANLNASGYSREQVDEIYVTHMHTDHVGGLTRDGKPNFPNAVVRADVREANYWLNQANADAAGGGKEDFESALAMFKPYIAAAKFKTFDGATELIPGIRAIPAPGHAPGHTIYVVQSKGEKLVVWGDLLHVAAIEFPEPSATPQFDWKIAQSAQQRRMNFADAAKHGYFVAAAHLAFPGIGKLRAEGGGYAWVPIAAIFGN